MREYFSTKSINLWIKSSLNLNADFEKGIVLTIVYLSCSRSGERLLIKGDALEFF